jgi:hypothetical protein
MPLPIIQRLQELKELEKKAKGLGNFSEESGNYGRALRNSFPKLSEALTIAYEALGRISEHMMDGVNDEDMKIEADKALSQISSL